MNEPPVDLRAMLNKRRKSQLIDLLLDIFEIYPNLIDELAIDRSAADQNLEDEVAAIFKNLQPWGHLSEAQVEAHLRRIARRADRLAERGRITLARRAYFSMIYHCVDLSRSFGHTDYFSPAVPYDFAVAYNALALKQAEKHGQAIRAELDEIFRALINSEALGLDDALVEICDKLHMFDQT